MVRAAKLYEKRQRLLQEAAALIRLRYMNFDLKRKRGSEELLEDGD